jgi:hypothetical protein
LDKYTHKPCLLVLLDAFCSALPVMYDSFLPFTLSPFFSPLASFLIFRFSPHRWLRGPILKLDRFVRSIGSFKICFRSFIWAFVQIPCLAF